MAWTTPASWPVGFFVTSAFLHAQIRDNLNELRSGGLAISTQGVGEIIYAADSSHLTRSANFKFDGVGVITINAAANASAFRQQIGGANKAYFCLSGYPKNDSSIDATMFAESGGGIQFMVNGSATAVGGFLQSGVFYTVNAMVLTAAQKFYFDSGSDSYIWENSSNNLQVFTGGVHRLNIGAGVTVGSATDPGANNIRVEGTSTLLGDVAAAGKVKSSGQPGFLVGNAGGQSGQVNGNTIVFDSEIYDELGNFASNTFTAPVAGRYLLTCAVTLSAGTASPQGRGIRLVTSNRNYQFDFKDGVTSTEAIVVTGAVVADMDAGDTAHVILVLTGGGTCTVSAFGSAGETWFSGRLLV